MKFVASVEINHRLAASYSMPKRRAQRSMLAFGTKQGHPNDLVLVHQSNQNSLGTVYKVKDNIERVFDKYAKDGKTTIRFKEPPHDVIINCEASALERFLAALKMGLRKNVCTKSLKLPVVGHEPLKKVPPKPKQHLIYNTRADYPTSKGFPKSAISIAINGLERTRFDMRLLGLSLLQVLDLSNNKLSVVPVEVDLLPSLTKLSLAQNQLGAARTMSSWSWLHGERLARRLKDLDLSGNEISFLPPAVCNLKALETLNVKNNKLTVLPGAIGTLKSLKTFVAADNQLEFLPGSIKLLKLWFLDVTDNPFVFRTPRSVPLECKVPSLLEWTARSVINNRVNFTPADLPLVVQHYLHTVTFCHCRQACFKEGISVYSNLAMNCIAANIVRGINLYEEVPVQYRLCSYQCVETFNSYCLVSELLCSDVPEGHC